jgi:hypothetical protein
MLACYAACRAPETPFQYRQTTNLDMNWNGINVKVNYYDLPLQLVLKANVVLG